jgi:hypothetical protein
MAFTQPTVNESLAESILSARLHRKAGPYLHC